MKRQATHHQQALTLVEMLVVLSILVITAAGIVVVTGGDAMDDARNKTTIVSIEELKKIIMGHAKSPGYLGDNSDYPREGPPPPAAGANHPQLVYLFDKPPSSGTFDPATKKGWRGPYVQDYSGSYTIDDGLGFTAAYGTDGDKAMLDGWGNPFIIQEPSGGTADDKKQYTRIISAGPNGIVDTARSDLMGTNQGDDIVIFLRQ